MVAVNSGADQQLDARSAKRRIVREFGRRLPRRYCESLTDATSGKYAKSRSGNWIIQRVASAQGIHLVDPFRELR